MIRNNQLFRCCVISVKYLNEIAFYISCVYFAFIGIIQSAHLLRDVTVKEFFSLYIVFLLFSFICHLFYLFLSTNRFRVKIFIHFTTILLIFMICLLLYQQLFVKYMLIYFAIHISIRLFERYNIRNET